MRCWLSVAIVVAILVGLGADAGVQAAAPPYRSLAAAAFSIAEQVSRRLPTRSAFTVSRDGETLAIARDWDSTITRWDLTTGQCLEQWRARERRMAALDFSPDGDTLVQGTEHAIELWDVPGGIVRRRLNGAGTVAFSPDGRLLATGSPDGTIRIWPMPDGYLLRRVKCARDPWNALLFSPDGRLLASETTNGSVRLWNPHTGDEHTPALGEAGAHIGDFSPDSRLLALSRSSYVEGALHSELELWDVKSHRTLKRIPGGNSPLAFSPDGALLATASDEGVAKLWDPRTGALLRTIPAPGRGVDGIAFVRAGAVVLLGWGWVVEMRHVPTGILLRTYQ